MDGQTEFTVSTGHSPTRSILYAFPFWDSSAQSRRRLYDLPKTQSTACCRNSGLKPDCRERRCSKRDYYCCNHSPYSGGVGSFCDSCYDGDYLDQYDDWLIYRAEHEKQLQADWRAEFERCRQTKTSAECTVEVYHPNYEICLKYWGYTTEECIEKVYGCFSGDGIVKIMQQGIVKEMRVSELAVGNYVFDGDEYSKIIAIETGYSAIKMMKLFLNDSMTLTLTSEHLLFDANHNSIHAKDIQIGDVLLNGLVVSNIEYNQFGIPFTPFTMSGKIEVNGVTASVYSVAASHDTAHGYFKPIRFLSEQVSEYYTATFVEYVLTDLHIIYEYVPNFWEYALNIHPVINVIVWIVVGSIFSMRQFMFYLFANYYPLELNAAFIKYLSL